VPACPAVYPGCYGAGWGIYRVTSVPNYYTIYTVRKTLFSLAVDPEQEQQSISLSTQIRNGIRLWLEQQGIHITEDGQQPREKGTG
jgi:hypothetical protein